MSISLEIVDFYRPTENAKTLYLTRISEGYTQGELLGKFYQIFSKYGLVNDVSVFGTPMTNENHGEDDKEQDLAALEDCYAFVKYYSVSAAAKALADLKGRLILKGKIVKLQLTSRRKQSTTGPVPLDITKCQELASYYLGFNGWSSKICSIEPYSSTCDQETKTSSKVGYLCQVQLDIIKHGLHCRGVGLWEETYKDATSRLSSVCKCKKFAHKRAMEDAFSKLVIVILGNGKITVEVNTTVTEKILVENTVHDGELLKVNELTEEPLDWAASDSEDSLCNVDDSGALDDINEQLLLELEAENFT